MKNKKKVVEETIAAKIPIGEMIVDSYQGHVLQRLVDQIADNWDEAAAGAVILNMREDGTYAVLDGQHRVLAAQKKGVRELPAMVFVGKTFEEEARLFVQLNTKHNVRAYDRFNANLISGKSEELTIKHICQEVGLEIAAHTFSRQPGVNQNRTRAITPLYTIYRNYGVDYLRMVVGILTASFGEYPDRGKGYSEAALNGMSGFLARYPKVDIKRLIERLKAVSPTVLLGRAFNERKGYDGMWVGWGRVITGIYNHGVRSTASTYLDPTKWDKHVISPTAKEKNKNSSGRFKSFKTIKTQDYTHLAEAAKTR